MFKKDYDSDIYPAVLANYLQNLFTTFAFCHIVINVFNYYYLHFEKRKIYWQLLCNIMLHPSKTQAQTNKGRDRQPITPTPHPPKYKPHHNCHQPTVINSPHHQNILMI